MDIDDVKTLLLLSFPRKQKKANQKQQEQLMSPAKMQLHKSLQRLCIRFKPLEGLQRNTKREHAKAHNKLENYWFIVLMLLQGK